ncbi:hypothetical protein ES703_104991 [subsurface metagenome]
MGKAIDLLGPDPHQIRQLLNPVAALSFGEHLVHRKGLTDDAAYLFARVER